MQRTFLMSAQETGTRIDCAWFGRTTKISDTKKVKRDVKLPRVNRKFSIGKLLLMLLIILYFIIKYNFFTLLMK